MTEHISTENLSAFIDGELPESERAAVEAHVASCHDCLDELESLRWTVELTKALPRASIPAGASFRVPIEGPIGESRGRLRPLYAWLAVGAAAAMVVVAIGARQLTGDTGQLAHVGDQLAMSKDLARPGALALGEQEEAEMAVAEQYSVPELSSGQGAMSAPAGRADETAAQAPGALEGSGEPLSGARRAPPIGGVAADSSDRERRELTSSAFRNAVDDVDSEAAPGAADVAEEAAEAADESAVEPALSELGDWDGEPTPTASPWPETGGADPSLRGSAATRSARATAPSYAYAAATQHAVAAATRETISAAPIEPAAGDARKAAVSTPRVAAAPGAVQPAEPAYDASGEAVPLVDADADYHGTTATGEGTVAAIPTTGVAALALLVLVTAAAALVFAFFRRRD